MVKQTAITFPGSKNQNKRMKLKTLMLTITALFDRQADFSNASCTILSWSSFELL